MRCDIKTACSNVGSFLFERFLRSQEVRGRNTTRSRSTAGNRSTAGGEKISKWGSVEGFGRYRKYSEDRREDF